ncbi:MAG: hypothetical protein N4A74_19965 [Carboxylicivirga sp.]|jgi:hypothetical protein|nr:hypothetical protein [Carboxylicivirga sp.]
MKLFEFLELISKEKFPFRLEYEEWSGNVKVIVDTFTSTEEYSFDENGMTELTEYQERKSTEDLKYINSKIQDLKNRPERAWIDASKDLGIRFIHPYRFVGTNGEEYEVTGLLPDFGFGKGVLITDRKSEEEAVVLADLTNEYAMTGLSPLYYDKYDKESFIETLSEWGWIGEESKKPNWIKNN